MFHLLYFTLAFHAEHDYIMVMNGVIGFIQSSELCNKD